MNGISPMSDQNKNELIERLREKSQWVWEQTLKIHRRSPETRVASSLSPIEIFVVLYYGGLLKQDPTEPLWSGRDRCVISKGHGSLCMYPVLADLGFFSMSELERVCEAGSFLGGIPDPVIPGYETVNGSLGHGVGVASGMALALKRRRQEQHVYVVTCDGEPHEGSNWEAFMFAAQHELNNLTVIVDNNQISMLGPTDNIVSHRDLGKKLEAFGWETMIVADGHNVSELYEVLSSSCVRNCPLMIIANTKKGHRVPGLENADLSHVTAIKPELIDDLLGELT